MRQRSFALITALLALTLVAAACSKDEPAPPAAGQTSAPPPVEVVPEGEYGYSSYGVKADLVPDGDTFKLIVTNKTGVNLGKPGVYALDAVDGHQIPGTVVDSQPLANGKSGEFAVSFGEGFRPDQVGLMILEFGSSNFGAFTSGTEET